MSVIEVADDRAASRRRPPVLALLLVLAVVVAAALRPQQLLSTLSSPRALLLVLAVVALTLLLRRVGRRLPAPVASGLTATPALIAVALLVVPTLRTTTVDEELADLQPVANGPQQAAASDAPGAAGPTRLATGAVEGIGHRGSGTASLVRLPDGALLVRFEGLSVDPGPDYRVYLVPGADREAPDGGQGLGKLKASSGNQNYPVEQPPADGPITALIWCEAFSVAIAAATLA